LGGIDAAVEISKHGYPAQQLSYEGVEFESTGEIAVVVNSGRSCDKYIF
jgi:hypothetical protein